MRFHRITFVGGLVIGYVLGAQAGRERYEQLKRLARMAAESPAMQQTAGALQAQATATAKSAKDKASSGVRKGTAKVTGRRSGAGRAETTSTVSGNGATRPAGSEENRPFAPTETSLAERDLT